MYLWRMLRPLPYTTFSEIVALQLEARVYCPRCRALRRRIDPSVDQLRDRVFAGARSRCRRCSTHGPLEIRPVEMLPVGGLIISMIPMRQ
jgi:hypothetical protein